MHLLLQLLADCAGWKTCPDLPAFTTGLSRSLSDLTGAAAGASVAAAPATDPGD